MKTIFAIVLCAALTGAAFGQVETTCNVNGNTVQCTSNDTGAAIAERNRENAAAGRQVGEAIGNVIYQARVRHAVKKFCKQNGHGAAYEFHQSNGVTVAAGYCQ